MIAKLFAILLGSFLLSVGINFFLIPHKLLDGGFIGIALLFNYLLDYHVGWTNLVCSIPVYIYAWFRRRSYFYNSVLGLLVSSLALDMLRYLEQAGIGSHMDPLFCSIAGGVLVGAGSGLMLRHKISTEGSDLLGLFLSEFFSINVGIAVLFIDALIIGLQAFILSDDPLLLSAIMIMAVSVVTGLFTFDASAFERSDWRPLPLPPKRNK
ncbi:YitT family protein [Paenibacillus doosanensis]|uniref:YitT family protein n=1 Tax=Paenibacillus konkukensis TaxID=2020716 RepID=A0ABY4RIL1_9BACL|nr:MULTISPECIES: YitT family protein [Paenibacillus]MCS7461943.1 YitT family protein [Paenibacillus doosanensis]UQZ81454.1 hypothetical protein SK3146_00610 [Paenibacillus konkukensis]